MNDRALENITSCDDSLDPANTVWIINISPHVRIDLQTFLHLSDQREVSTLMNEPAQRLAIDGLVEHCTSYCTVRDGLTVQGVAIRDRGRCTTTIDPQKNARIGIHLDSWDRLPIPRRATARNRLNVNLGAGNRYFLFAARSIMEMAEHLDATNHLRQHPTGLAREWLRTHPDEPIYKVTVRPGEAYIAPTEVLPHDSSTTDKTHMDISLTILGHFNVMPWRPHH